MTNIVMELSPWEVYRILAALYKSVRAEDGPTDELIKRFELCISRTSPVKGTKVHLTPDTEENPEIEDLA
jgi:hypothetical protein